MAQILAADFPIEPTTTSGTDLAAILNRLQAAQDSNNAGNASPSVTFAGQQWLDLSGGGNGVLRLRDAANASWLTLYDSGSPPVVGGSTIAGSLGSAAAPGFSFAGDSNTGMFSPGADQVALSAGGVLRFQVNNGLTLSLQPMTIQDPAPLLTLNRSDNTKWAGAIGQFNAKNRWAFVLGDDTNEAGSNAGSNAVLYRYDDAGGILPYSLYAERSTGNVIIPSLFLSTDKSWGFSQDSAARYANYDASGGGSNWTYNKASGLLSWGAKGKANILQIAASGTITASNQVMAGGTGNAPDACAFRASGPSGGGVALYDTSGGMRASMWTASGGNFNIASINDTAGVSATFTLMAGGTFLSPGPIAASGDTGFAMFKSGGSRYFQYTGSYYWRYDDSAGDLHYISADQFALTLRLGANGVVIRGGTNGLVFENVAGTSGNHIAFGWGSGNAIGVRVDNTQVGWLQVQTSDETLKTDVAPLPYDPAAFAKVQPITYRWLDSDVRSSERTFDGFSAQNVATAYPNVVQAVEGMPLGIDNLGLIAQLWAHVQALTDTLRTVQRHVRQLQEVKP
jgi:hypothetical protein